MLVLHAMIGRNNFSCMRTIAGFYSLIFVFFNALEYTVICLSIGTPKTINFPFVPNGKFIVLRCPKI